MSAVDDDTALIAGAYGWTTQQVADMGPVARQLALDFLSTRTATPRPTLRQRATALHWRLRRALWLHRHRRT